MPVFELNIYAIPPWLSVLSGLLIAFLSFIRGRGAEESTLFGIVCLLWTALPGSYVVHYLPVNREVMLSSDRWMTSLYAFLPFFNILLFHRILRLRRRLLEVAFFVMSVLSSVLAQLPCFYTGLLEYSWGVIASGGPCFGLFGLYSASGTVYAIVLVALHLKQKTERLRRLKIQYILLALITGALLNLVNVLPLYGIDVYPLGNLTFIAMSIMAYGILKHRLMEVESLFSLTVMWIVTSLLIGIPNGIGLILFREYLAHLNTTEIILLGMAWFYANFVFVRRIQPMIDRLFHRHAYNLQKAESRLVNQILLLRSTSMMRQEFLSAIERAIGLTWADLLIREKGSNRFHGIQQAEVEVNDDVHDWFLGADHLCDRATVEIDPYYALIRSDLLDLFEKTKASSMVPLMQNGVLQGLLVFGGKANGKVLHRDEIAFIEHVKAAGAIALSNASLYQDLNELKDHLEGLVADRTAKLQRRTDQMTFELRLASVVQKSILPPAVQEPPGLRLAARMIPMMEVSGDFYYARPLSDRRYGVAIIDVSGHGMPAALLTSMIKTEIDRQFVDGRSTAEICSALGEELAPALAETGLYFTAFVGIIDRDSRRLHYTGCGHIPPVIVRSSKDLHILESRGVVLGSSLFGVYQSQSTELHPGDRLFLFTDGLMDASDESGEAFGEERLYALMQSGARKPAGEQLEEILGSVSGYRSNGSRSDDMTLMIVDVE